MKNLNCKNCGGTMVLNASAMEAVCRYCGTKYVLNHEDTDYFRNFYEQMTKLLSFGSNDTERRERADKLWENAHEKTFFTTDDTPIEIRYMYAYTDKDADVYVTRRNIVFHMNEDGMIKADKFRRNVSMLDYPTADTRSLSDFFPRIIGGYELADSTYLLVIEKSEDEYPLRLFGKLSGRHAAWIVSRLENICCVLEYSSLVHPQINIDTLYINPYTHQASLYGNWWCVERNNRYSEEYREILTTRKNLVCLRETAAAVLGFPSAIAVEKSEDVPAPFAAFLKSVPSIDAYNDFSLWDQSMIAAYGERKFINMNTDDDKIYNGER